MDTHNLFTVSIDSTKVGLFLRLSSIIVDVVEGGPRNVVSYNRFWLFVHSR